ncbi:MULTISPECIES: class F sortase [unclassified Streptomyces]|uniref:class F sortase n=1 Tax=unclassified Streptomyces TaxID=2593676 RepID=UPI000DB98778|nr:MULTISPECIES: class F sortase [unclassified Streptomyces]MYU06944.1 class F sortase [Streptomyces sp. SID8366]MYU63882.1 class F sortase [Streptomyces sp. SID69]RAJ61177.1 LPXTG-site transpeptidase (sortase) family protein [Streptomyces sp. PsTaAH-130]
MAADPSSAQPPEPEPDASGAARGGRLVLWGVAILFLAVSMFGGGHHGSFPAPRATPASGASSSGAGSTERAPVAVGLPRSEPTRLVIPKIGVDAPFTELTLASTGQLQPPPAANTNLVGWYAKGAAPGEKGTAIIAGHVDTKVSAAVFVNLDQLDTGDHFSVERADGRTADFVVDSAETFAKDDFPSDRVYADTARPEARLITCAGDYDHTAKDYTDNLVVFAHLV